MAIVGGTVEFIQLTDSDPSVSPEIAAVVAARLKGVKVFVGILISVEKIMPQVEFQFFIPYHALISFH